MRTLLILFLSFFIYTCVVGQTEQHNFLIGGSMSLNKTNLKWKSDNESGDYGTEFNFNLKPSFGFFVADGLAIGLNLDIEFSEENNDEEDETLKSSMNCLGLFIRYYFLNLKVKPFLHGDISTGNINIKAESSYYGSNSINGSVTKLDFGGGVAFFFTDNTSLELIAYYGNSSVKPNDDNYSNYRQIQSGLGIDIGFNIFF